MRTFITILLAVLVVAQSMEAQQTGPVGGMKQSIAALPPKAHVALHLTDGSSIRGHVARLGDSDFVVKQDGGAGLRTISYQQVQSIEQIKPEHSKTKWVIIGIVAGAVVVVAVVAVHIAHHPLGSGPGF